MPAADFCPTVRVDPSTLSPDSGTCGRPPEVSSTAFNAQPPDLQPAPLMDMDFAVLCPLVRRRMPHIRFLSIGSRLCSTLLSDPASRRCPCASLSLLLHQDVKGTYTPKLLNMLGTQRKRPDRNPASKEICNCDLVDIELLRMQRRIALHDDRLAGHLFEFAQPFGTARLEH